VSPATRQSYSSEVEGVSFQDPLLHDRLGVRRMTPRQRRRTLRRESVAGIDSAESVGNRRPHNRRFGERQAMPTSVSKLGLLARESVRLLAGIRLVGIFIDVVEVTQAIQYR